LHFKYEDFIKGQSVLVLDKDNPYFNITGKVISKEKSTNMIRVQFDKSIQSIEPHNLKNLEYQESWIGVDLDGTLAHYDGWKGFEHIGDPIPATVDLINKLISEGTKVKIFTARAIDPGAIPTILDWIKVHNLPDMEVTNIKDLGMIALIDDRAIRININSGELCKECKSNVRI